VAIATPNEALATPANPNEAKDDFQKRRG